MNRCERCGTWRRKLEGGECRTSDRDACRRRMNARAPVKSWVKAKTKRLQPGYVPARKTSEIVS